MKLPGPKTLLVGVAIGVAALVSVGGGATYAALEITTRPQFCRSCHIMEPYYDSWASSSHSNVSCVECHYEPGLLETFEGKFKALSQLAKYVTSTEGSKPWAEVSDYSCMRSGCHSTRLLEGEISFGRIRFDHRAHLIGLRSGEKLRCTSCHSQIVQGNHLTVTTSTCILCHFKGQGENGPINDCAKCHGPPTNDIVLDSGLTFSHKEYLARGVECKSCHADVTRGTGEVPPERCGSCHNKQEHLERIGDVTFIHQTHVTDHSVKCIDCHLEIQHGLPNKVEHARGKCEDCHPGTHATGSDVYRGTGGAGVADRPGPMFLARVTCDGCHRPPFPGAPVPPAGTTWKADPLACLDCHGAGFEGMVGRWQDQVRNGLSQVQAGMAALHARLGEGAGSEAHTRYDEAAQNVGLVLMDGSDGAHNLLYVRDLLTRAADDVRAGWQALPAAGPAPALEVVPPVHSQAECATMCHVGIEQVSVKRADGSTFKHGPHLLSAVLDCSSCHAAEPHGAPPPSRATCASCHHTTDDADTCGQCHTQVAELRARTVPGLDAVPMQDVDCLMCHIGLEPGAERETARSSCEMCHAGEGRDPAAWIAAASAPLDELEAALPGAPAPAADEARAAIDALRSAGPFHNPAWVESEARRLRALLAPAPPPEPTPPPTGPPAVDPGGPR